MVCHVPGTVVCRDAEAVVRYFCCPFSPHEHLRDSAVALFDVVAVGLVCFVESWRRRVVHRLAAVLASSAAIRWGASCTS